MNVSKDISFEHVALARRLPVACVLLALYSNLLPALADSWQQRAPVPGGRAAHSAVWTGREMIVWGGDYNSNLLNTGARYNPTTAAWTALTQASRLPRAHGVGEREFAA
jgi:hypothetical protein